MKNKTVWAAALLGAFTAVQVYPSVAGATTLLDLLRGGPANSSKNRPVKPLFGSQSATDVEADPEPLPRISGPRYYTYKPESLRLLKTAQFAPVNETDVTTTGSISNEPVADQRRFMVDAKVYATDDIGKSVEDYYASGKPLIWVSGEAVTSRATEIMAALADAGQFGLDPADYAVDLPAEVVAGAEPDARDRELMRFELALSVKVLTYVQDTVRGRIDPNKLSGYHDFKRKTVNLTPVLNMLRLSPDVGAYLRSRDPDNAQFAALKGELERLRQEDSASGPPIVVAPGTLLKPGGNSAELANIVALIKANGSDALKLEHSVVLAGYAGTPAYSPELVSLVEAFQSESGLKPDGVVGPATIRALTGHSNAEKIEKLVVAMEQLRWLPDDLGSRFVFINQPAFRAYYFDESREQLSMRVVVGSRSNQTYFFQDQIETVEVNPYWGVPASIIVNEMLPKLRADPSYLDRLGYEVSYGGRKVSSSQVDWNSTHQVDVRQPPGSGNALGELKILFPNSHSIYMHDTPSKSFFNRDMRALSHGCVRLAEPRVMAAAVMGTSVGEIGRQIAQGQNKALPVPQKVPVYVSYFTAWPNKDGAVEYFDDVYGRDDYTGKAFSATSQARSGRS